jgi:hypothetical protein
LFRQVLLVVRYGVCLDDGVILVVEIEQVGGNSDAHGITLTTVTIHFHSHYALLALRAASRSRCGTGLDPKTRTCYNRE